MPTRRGRATLAAALACFFLGRALGVPELYAVALAGVFVVALASLSVRWARYRLAFSRRIRPGRAFPDDTVRVELSVRNVGRISSPPLLVEDTLPDALGGPSRWVVDSLAPETVRALTVDRLALTRGKYKVGPLRVRLVDPFGLAELTTQNKREDLLVVYPRIEMLGRGAPPSQRMGSGPAKVMRLSPEGDEFYAIREYEDGDDLRKIHWNSVARTGQLMIRQEEARLHPRATLLLDTRTEAHRGSGPHSSFEWAVSACASMTWHLGRAGHALRLATDVGGPGAPRAGKPAVEGILELLAAVGPGRRGTLLPAIKRLGTKPGAGGAIIAVLPPPPPEELAALGRLRSAYGWCGAILMDSDSFVGVSPRVRALADQRAAAAETALVRAGWRVRVAGSNDRIGDAWTGLIAAPGSRRRSASSPS
ncbi:MAG: DUF58 domain-containing protein [Actinomycetota bacterium]|nr:DUF58 domain-containing protein [Actinomycetota bacterium]